MLHSEYMKLLSAESKSEDTTKESQCNFSQLPSHVLNHITTRLAWAKCIYEYNDSLDRNDSIARYKISDLDYIVNRSGQYGSHSTSSASSNTISEYSIASISMMVCSVSFTVLSCFNYLQK